MSSIVFCRTRLLSFGYMRDLKWTIDELAAVDICRSSDHELREEVVELSLQLDRLRSQWLRRLAELDQRSTAWSSHGHLSPSSWLADHCRMALSKARETIRVARALARMPTTRRALEEGRLSFGQTRALLPAFEAHPDSFLADEPTLVGVVQDLQVSHVWRVVDYWRLNVDREAILEECNDAYARRRLYASSTYEGIVRLDGEFDPEGGQVIRCAIQALSDPGARDPTDSRTPAQRRADALVEVCRRFLDSDNRPRSGGEKPHVSVLVDLDSLQASAGWICETEAGQTLHPEAIRRLLCDASVSRVVTRGRSEPLDVGRRTRTIGTALRRALTVRDRGCRFPGCERSAAWCDGHHIRHWLAGGPTRLDNLILVCRPHHRLLHEGGFEVEPTKEGPRFRKREPG